MASRNGVQTWTKPTKQFHPCPQSTCRQNGEGPCLPTQLPARPYTFSLCCGGSQDVRVLPGSPQEGGRLHKVQEEKGKDFQMGVVTLLQLWVEEDKGTGGQGHPCLHIWSPAMASVISQLLQFEMTSPRWKTDFLVTECGSPLDCKSELMLSQAAPIAELYGEGVILHALEHHSNENL